MFLKEVSSAALTQKGWTIMTGLFGVVFILNAAVLWIAMKSGEKRLVRYE
jgi:hypothetical protein